MKGEHKLLSIIVPVYKVEKYLRQCIDSVVSQENGEAEIILVDDGSPDRCGDICDEYSGKYSFIKVIHQKNSGLSEARNAGIRRASGEYCVFLDSDDFLCEGAIGSLCRHLAGRAEDVLVIRTKQFIEKDDEVRECRYWFHEEKLSGKSIPDVYDLINEMEDFWGAAWMFVVRRIFLLNHGLLFSAGILHEDEDWVPRMFLQAGSVAFCNDCIYCVRVDRIGSITHTETTQHEIDKIWIIRHLLNEIKSGHYDKREQHSLIIRCAKIYVGILKGAGSYGTQESEVYNEIISGLKGVSFILRKTGFNRYLFLYFLIKTVGFKRSASFIQKYSGSIWSRGNCD